MIEKTGACTRLLEEHLRAENEHNVQRIMDTYGQEPVVSINGQVFEGCEKIRSFHERFGFGQSGGFSDIQVREKKRYLCEQAIILELMLSGKHTGKWQGIEATGRSFEIPVCTIYLFNQENKLVEERVYFDQTLIIRALET